MFKELLATYLGLYKASAEAQKNPMAGVSKGLGVSNFAATAILTGTLAAKARIGIGLATATGTGGAAAGTTKVASNPQARQMVSDETAIMSQHLQKAVADAQATSYTQQQLAAIANHPRLAAAYRGDLVDTLFKRMVKADPRLQHLKVTPRFKFGPDVYNPSTGKWWDVTRLRQWNAHVKKYVPRFGKGIPLLY